MIPWYQKHKIACFYQGKILKKVPKRLKMSILTHCGGHFGFLHFSEGAPWFSNFFQLFLRKWDQEVSSDQFIWSSWWSETMPQKITPYSPPLVLINYKMLLSKHTFSQTLCHQKTLTHLCHSKTPFLHLIVKQVTIFGKKLDFSKISTNLTKCWEIFGHCGPVSPYFFDAFHWKTPFFDAICHRKIPTCEVLGGTRTSLVCPPPRCNGTRAQLLCSFCILEIHCKITLNSDCIVRVIIRYIKVSFHLSLA